MKQFKIEVPDGYEIDQENSNLAEGVIKFKPVAKESRVPESIKFVKDRRWFITGTGHIHRSLDSNCKNHFSTKERAEAMLALGQLIELHTAIGQSQDVAEDQIIIRSVDKNTSIHLWFESGKLMNEFYSTHKQLIETVAKGL